MNGVEIQFPNTSFAAIQLHPGHPLADYLTAENSPVLFGCRTGICGTCLVRVVGKAAPASTLEQEVLDVLAPHQPEARLACQLKPKGPLQIEVLDV